MKLWLISQKVHQDYDTYDSAVVLAETEEEARRTHPDGEGPFWDTDESYWRTRCWALPEDVSVQYLGEAADELVAAAKSPVICASFNAG